jgi:spore germination protein PF
MPVTISGPVQIDAITFNGVVRFGDSLVISPKEVDELYAGSGAFNTGFLTVTNSGLSSTNFIDPSIINQPISGNH